MHPAPPAPHPGDRSAPPAPPEVNIVGHRFHSVTEVECVDYVMAALTAGQGGWIVTHNLDHLRRLRQDESFRSLCATADLAVADGAPIVWAAALQGDPLPERVAGSDLISSLSAGAAAGGHSVYLLGGNPGAAEGAAKALTERFPKLRIAGHSCPEFGFDKDPQRLEQIMAELEAARPSIVFVALGSPKQEELIGRCLHCLPRAWWIGIGISFSFLTGEVTRAPQWMRKLGLEWVHRLCQEPKRLAGRYIVDGIPFGIQVLGSALGRRFGRTDR